MGEGGDRYLRSMVWTIGLGTLGLAAFVWSIVFVASETTTRRVRAAWETGPVTTHTLRAKFPSGGASPAAVEAEELAHPLGVDLTPRRSERWEKPPIDPSRIPQFFRKTLGRWVDAQVTRDRRGIEPAPPEAAEFLDRHRSEIVTLAGHLVASDDLRWEQDVDLWMDAPMPNLLGLMELQRVLHADALHRLQAGDREAALRSLEGTWRLGSTLRARPELISQLIATALTRVQLGVLRQIDDVPAAWSERLETLDVRTPFVDSLRVEGWIAGRANPSTLQYETEGNVLRKVAVHVFAPYVEYCFAEASDRMRTRAERLADLPWLCDGSLELRGVPTELRLPPWNLLGAMADHDVGGSIERVARLELDVEMTVKVLALDRVRRATGRWPTDVAGIGSSRVCPHDRWIYEVTADGATLRFPRELAWSDPLRNPPPTTFHVPTPTSTAAAR
jgi:hypothetical protein